MSNDALYLYGIVKNEYDIDWAPQGIDGNPVFTLTEGSLSAVVHEFGEKPDLPTDVVKVKEQIIAHNEVLSEAIGSFGGVVPLKFGTVIVGKNGKSASYNLKEWLKEGKERLEKTWELVKGKKEYGIRIYYQKKQLVSELEETGELSAIKRSIGEKSAGVAYLLEGKLKSETAELLRAKVHQFKSAFYERLKGVTDNLVVNKSKLAINGEGDLLLNVSVLVRENEITFIKESLEKYADDGFSYHLVGPFAPYSFVENIN